MSGSAPQRCVAKRTFETPSTERSERPMSTEGLCSRSTADGGRVSFAWMGKGTACLENPRRSGSLGRAGGAAGIAKLPRLLPAFVTA